MRWQSNVQQQVEKSMLQYSARRVGWMIESCQYTVSTNGSLRVSKLVS